MSGLAYWTAKCQNSRLNIFGDSSQTETSVNLLTELLAEVSGAQVPVAYEPARPGDILRSMLRNAEVRRHLGWEPATSLREGLARTYRSLHS